MALGILGDDPIASMIQGTKASTLADSLFETERDATLGSYEWNFAVKRASIAKLATAPAFGYSARFQLPTDCIRVLELYPEAPFVVEGRELLCNLTTAAIRYTRRVSAPSEWTPTFKSAFAARLAWQMSFSLTESVQAHDRFERRFLGALNDARTADAQEGSVKSALGSGAHILADVRHSVGDASWYDDRNDTRDFGALGG
jgi:hypothetical protein